MNIFCKVKSDILNEYPSIKGADFIVKLKSLFVIEKEERTVFFDVPGGHASVTFILISIGGNKYLKRFGKLK